MKINTTYGVFILLIMILNSCQKDDPGIMPEEEEMIFDAAEMDKSNPTTTYTIPDFRVTAYEDDEWGSGKMLMDNIVVTRVGLNKWTYSPPVSWPVENGVDFYAVSPAWIKMNNNYWWEHTLDFDGMNMGVDLLVSVKKGASQHDGRIRLNFRHALARLRVNLKCSSENLQARVKKVSIWGFPDRGTFFYPKETTAPDGDGSALINNWTIYNKTAVSKTLFEAVDDGYLGLSPESESITDQDLFVIPMSLDEMEDGKYVEGTHIEITYQMVDADSGKVVWPTVEDYGVSRLELYHATPGHRWLPGKGYRYTIDVGIPSTRSASDGCGIVCEESEVPDGLERE